MKKDNETISSKKKASSKKSAITIVLVVLLLVVVAAAVFIVLKMKDDGVFSGEEALENTKMGIEALEDYVEPGEGALDISNIQGFTDSAGSISENVPEEGTVVSESVEDNSGSETTPVIVLSDPELTAEAVGSYSGNFLEDGSDEPTANVAAMVVTNNSERMLQIAEITFQVNDTETASFKVTNLPAGTSVLVLESNKREFKEEDSYTYGETASGYMDQPTLEEDKFELVTEKGKIILKNNTDQSYEKVYVYYKYVQLGGAYLGGITYRTPFENVPAGGEVEAVAGHFNPGSSKIMAVQIQEQ